MTLSKIQQEVGWWAQRNFPDRKPHQPLLGALEELGELAHAHLKLEQGIRTNEDHESKRVDALGDIVIYLLDYCELHDLDLETIVKLTWGVVKKRDWKKNPENGESGESTLADAVDLGPTAGSQEK